MKKILIILSSTVFTVLCSAQNQMHNNWFANAGLGFSKYEKKGVFKINSSNYYAFLGKEIQINTKNSLLAGLKIEELNGNFSDMYITSHFLSIPVLYRHYFLPKENAAFFCSFGIENKFKVYENLENIAFNINSKGENAYHLGGLIEIGYKTKAVENLDCTIGLNYSGDIATAGYDNVKTKKPNGINLFLGFSLYKKNEK